jgi:hypothetical protein
MKKSRLATKLSLLADQTTVDRLITAVFHETSSIGVRYFPVERRALDRVIRSVKVLGRTVRIKAAALDGRVVNAQPEYEDCLRVSRDKGVPLKDVIRKAAAEYAKQG